MRTRANAFSNRGIISTSTLQASREGAKMIERGGNVADAAITASSVLAVTHNDSCGLGGDMFALIRMNGKRILDLNGSGKSSHNASIDLFRNRGLTEIPSFGPLAALTVPGMVDAWRIIHDDFATMDLDRLLEPAIRIARDGFPVTHEYRRSLEAGLRRLGTYGWKNVFAPQGVIPEIGSMFRQKDLSQSLALIASEGTETFYRGYLADKIHKAMQKEGIILDDVDLRNHKSRTGNPVSTDYNGMKIYENKPNSQAITVLLWLNLYGQEIEGKERRTSSEHLKEAIETGLIAYEERSKYIGDPDTFHPAVDLTSPAYASKLLSKRRHQSSSGKRKSDDGDTTYFAVADRDGNSLSIIQSNYMGFGTGMVPEGTGFVLQNRGSYFSLDDSHHNSLGPGKRTFHTLGACMAENEGEFSFSLGTMGGDIQPQIQFQLLTGLIDDSIDPQLVLDRPRWSFPHTIYEKPTELRVEEAHSLGNLDIKRIPMSIKRIPNHSIEMGQAHMVQMNSEGILVGGADPRGDGFAIPFD